MKKYILFFSLMILMGCQSNFDKANMAILRKDYNTAEKILEKIHSNLNSIDSEAISKYYLLQGNLFFFRFKFEAAKKSYKISLEIGGNKMPPGKKIELFRNLADDYCDLYKFDSAKIYYQQLAELSHQQSDFYNYAYGLNRIVYVTGYNNSPKEKQIFQESFHIADSINSKKIVGMAYIILGSSYYSSKNDSTIFYYKKAIECFEESKDSSRLISAYNNLGDCFMRTKDYNAALSSFNRAYELALITNNIKYLDIICANIGALKMILNDYAGAKKFFLKSILNGNLFSDTVGRSYSKFNLAVLSMEMKSWDEAIDYFFETIQLSINFDRTVFLGLQSYQKIAEIYYFKNDLNNAKKYCLITLDSISSKKFNSDDLEIEANISLLLAKMGYFQKAKSIALKNFAKFDFNQDFRHQLVVAQTLSICFEHEKDIQNSLKYLKIINKCKDSIAAKNELLEIGKLQAQIENKETYVKQHNELQSLDEQFHSNKKFQNYIILSSIIILLVAGLLFFQLKINKRHQLEQFSKNKIIQKQNQELVESNISLEHFARVSSHDISGPLSTISNLNNQIQKKYQAIFSKEEMLTVKQIDENCQDLIGMIQGFLNFSLIVKNLPPAEIINLNELIDSIEKKIIFQEPQKDIHILKLNSLPQIKAHPFLVIQLFYNLLSNSIKYSKKELATKIEIESRDLNGFHQISVKDNGIGIPKEFQAKAFDLFAKLHKKEEYPGQGIGLSTCKKIVNYYGGKIWMESIEGIGTTIYFTVLKTYLI